MSSWKAYIRKKQLRKTISIIGVILVIIGAVWLIAEVVFNAI